MYADSCERKQGINGNKENKSFDAGNIFTAYCGCYFFNVDGGPFSYRNNFESFIGRNHSFIAGIAIPAVLQAAATEGRRRKRANEDAALLQ